MFYEIQIFKHPAIAVVIKRNKKPEEDRDLMHIALKIQPFHHNVPYSSKKYNLGK